MKLNPGQTVTVGAKTYVGEVPDKIGKKLGIKPPVEPVAKEAKGEDPVVTVELAADKKGKKKK